MSNKGILVCGDAMVDVHLKPYTGAMKSLQLGGVFHSARTLSSLRQSFGLGFIAPSYLTNSIRECASKLRAVDSVELGCVEQAPNVMLVGDSTESGDQGYLELLGQQREVSFDWRALEKHNWEGYSDALVYPGAYDWIGVTKFFQKLGKLVHVDLQYVSSSEIRDLEALNGLSTVFLSTSSPVFLEVGAQNPDYLAELLLKQCQRVILKENRGGSRAFLRNEPGSVSIPCYAIAGVHSVGVGDCYNATFLATVNSGCSEEVALNRASLAAAFYASTLDFTELNSLLSHLPELDLELFEQIRLPWETRQQLDIYLAAPDFPGVDTRLIDVVEQNLIYHNFVPHRPIKENGLITGQETLLEELSVFEADLALLDKCSALVAVVLTEDPGTIAELGYFSRMGKPTILFDPFRKINNMFVRRLANRICFTCGELTQAVFEELGGTEL